MAKDRKKIVPLKKFLIYSYILAIALPTIFLIGSIASGILYATTERPFHLIFLIVFGVICLATFAVAGAFLYKRLQKLFFNGFYKVTQNNIKSIINNHSEIQTYPIRYIEEINGINDDLDALNYKLKKSTFISSGLDYSELPLEFVDKQNTICTLSTFKNNLQNIVMQSASFRNMVIQLHYELSGSSGLSEEDISFFIRQLKEAFVDYSNFLIVLDDESRKDIFVYLPNIDSFLRIEQILTNIVDNLSVSDKTSEGIVAVPVKIVGVAYPYSEVEEIFHDLNYASHTNEIINFYFPNRISNATFKDIKTNSSNLNLISKCTEQLGHISTSLGDIKKSKEQIKNAVTELMNYLGVDQCGVAYFDDERKTFMSELVITNSKNPLFKEGKPLEDEFVKALGETIDADNSYYFSQRSHANNEIGRYLDKFSIDGGFYYVIKNGDDMKGIVYFLNRNQDFNIDSYLREGLLLVSTKIGEFYINMHRENEVASRLEDIHNILKLTEYFVYRIDKDTHEIVSFSKNASTYAKDIKEGIPCYKAIYGLEKVCKNCPLLTHKRMVCELNQANIETSLTLLNDNSSRYVTMTARNMSKEEDSFDYYNKDLLINSYPLLAREMEACYSVAGKGYFLILRIDNLDELIVKFGSEKTLVGMRNFFKDIKESNMGIQNIFYFNTHSVGILFKELGQIDVVNKCETIYELSKKNYFNDDEINFILTYLPMNYPSGYAKSNDFLKHCNKFFASQKGYSFGKDYIFFEENDYTRSASRKEFMLSVIDDKFGNSTFKALLQPYVRAANRNVYGAEMLLRLTDDYRKIVFNPDELIKVAAANDKMTVISDALVNFIGNLFRKQGSSIFKVFGLKRLSINTDFSYFQNEEGIEHLIQLVRDYSFPKEFLGFEINEWDIKAHYEQFAKITPLLINHNITLICDQYSGRDLSIEKLNAIGFSEVKIGRSIGGFVDSDPAKKAACASIIESAKAFNMGVSVVGIENIEQYDIIRKLDDQALLQGYYFFKPLEKEELINALRSSNSPTNS